MHSSLVGRMENCWIVEAPDGDHHVLSGINIVTGGVPAFGGMEGVMISLSGRRGTYRRFYARWSSGSPICKVMPAVAACVASAPIASLSC